MNYRVKISARRVGAIGQHGTEQREYLLCDVATRDDVNRHAIDRAYRDGDIEHVRVVHVEEA